MAFEHEKYLRAIKPIPAPPSMAPFLPEIISNWAEEEYRERVRRMDEEARQREMFSDLDGYLHRSWEEARKANQNIRQEHGTENKSLDYNI